MADFVQRNTLVLDFDLNYDFSIQNETGIVISEALNLKLAELDSGAYTWSLFHANVFDRFQKFILIGPVWDMDDMYDALEVR